MRGNPRGEPNPVECSTSADRTKTHS